MKVDHIQKEYEKYGFLNFESVNKEFELTGLELDKWDFLNSFCRLVEGKLGKFVSYTTALIMPGGNYHAIVQGGVKDKLVLEEAHLLYRDLMIHYHESLKAQLASEKEQVVFLKAFLKKYPLLKERVLVLLDACQQVFVEQGLDKKKESRGYLG